MIKKERLSRVLAIFVMTVGLNAQSFPLLDNAWNNPDFRDRVMGSYGIRSDGEPGELSREEGEFFNAQIVPAVNGGNYRAAIVAMEGFIQPETNANFDFTLGTLYLQDGRLAEARRSYEAAIRKFPEFMRVYKNLGITLTQMGDYNEARKMLQKAIELGDYNGDTFGLLGFNFYNQGNFLAALDAYRLATTLNPENRDWKIGKSRALHETGNHREAIAAVRELIEENPSDSRLWLSLANGYIGMEDLGKATSALEVLRRMKNPDAASLMLLGDLYTNQFLPKLAYDVYVQAIEKGVSLERALPIAEVFVQRGNLEEAEKLIALIQSRYADGLEGKAALKLLNLEAMLALQKGQDDRAAEVLEAILKEDPNDGKALLLLAQYNKGRGEYVEADYYFDLAQRVSDMRVRFDAFVEQAVMKVGQQDLEKAASSLREALAIRDEARVKRYLEAVERATQR